MKNRPGATHKIVKPVGAFSSGWIIKDGFLYAIFEYEDRVKTVKIQETNKTNDDWKSFTIKEDEKYYTINLN